MKCSLLHGWKILSLHAKEAHTPVITGRYRYYLMTLPLAGLPDDLEEDAYPEPLSDAKKGYYPVQFTHTDMLLILVITFVSFWTRHFMIQFPERPVFDESHFGRFTNHYIHGTYFFDIHPPLAKLIIFALAKVNQYEGNFNFSDPNTYPDVDYVGLRQIPALFASFCAPVVFVGCRCFGFSTIASFTAALMIICENSMVVEGRFILTDGILHFFVCLTFATTAAVRTQLQYSFTWWIAVIFNGIAAGCAVSCKMTALSVLPFLGLVHFIELIIVHYRDFNFKEFRKQFWLDLLVRGCVIAFMVIMVFYWSFVAHFILLPYKGSRDNLMPEHFQQSLLNKGAENLNWRLRTKDQNMIKNVVWLNWFMQHYNMKIGSNHPYGSKWYTWPFLTGKWVLFWTSGPRHIMCHGQVFNVYCGTLSVIANVLLGIYRFAVKRNFEYEGVVKYLRSAIFAFGYAASLFPFAIMTRALFFYHYIIPNIFGTLNFVSMIESWLNDRMRGALFTYAQILTGLAFFFWSPWTYGIPMEDFDIRLWNRAWQ